MFEVAASPKLIVSAGSITPKHLTFNLQKSPQKVFSPTSVRQISDPLEITYTAAWLQNKLQSRTHPVLTPKSLLQKCPWLSNPIHEVEKERKMKDSRLNYLRSACNLGEFKSFEWDIARCCGRYYRVNGNHSSNILFNDGSPICYEGSTVILRFYELGNDFEKLTALWSMFDNKESARTYEDILEMGCSTNEHLKVLTATEKKRIVAAISFVKFHGVSYKSFLRAGDKVKLIQAYPDKKELVNILILARSSQSRCLFSAPVMAAMLIMNKVSMKKSKKFWSLVANASVDQSSVCPTARLREYLVHSKNNSSADYEQLCANCFLAWNKWNGNIREMAQINHNPMISKNSKLLAEYRKQLERILGTVKNEVSAFKRLVSGC